MDVTDIRKDFPLLSREVHGQPLVYLDNAATTHKPRPVLDAITRFYTDTNSNIHRGAHFLSDRATDIYEEARATVCRFINASTEKEIIFTSGTTASINLVAHSFAEAFLKEGDEVITTELEHHSNIVPWQRACLKTGAQLKFIPLSEHMTLNLEMLRKNITEKTKLISVGYVSNAFGVINPVEDIIGIAGKYNIPVLVDAAQAVHHFPVDVQKLDCDFLAFSGHKMYAATGIGVLWGKKRWLEQMPPFHTGGGMIDHVSTRGSDFAGLPHRFEAGTPPVAQACSLAAAISYIEGIGRKTITEHENGLLRYAADRLSRSDGITLYTPADRAASALSFNVTGFSSYDVALMLDKMGIAVRSGRHCAEPAMQSLGINGTVRASVAMYNTKKEVDLLLRGIDRIRSLAGVSPL